MKRKSLAVLLTLAVLGTSLVGCSGSGSTSSDTKESSKAEQSAETDAAENENKGKEDSASGEKVTLRWALWDLEGTAYWRPLAEAYMAENPNVEIEYVDLGSADYSVMLATQLAGSSDLDVIVNKEIPPYENLITQGHLEPLNEYMAENDIKSEDYNGIIEQITHEGEVYALPFRNDFWLTFYNKDLFDAAGVEYPTNDMSFEEYQELAKKVTSGEGNEKVYGNYYHTWWSTIQHFALENHENSIYTDDYSFMKPYYESVVQAQEDGTCMDYATLKTSGTHYSGVFYNEQTAMMHMGSWFIAMQMDKVKSGESLAENWGIVKFPHIEGVEAGTGPSTLTTMSVNANSQNKEIALDFIKFVSGEEGAKIMASLGAFPALMNEEIASIITSLDGFPQDEASKEALVTADTILEMPMNEKGAEMLTIISEGHDDIMTGNTTVDDGLAKMGERAKEILSK